ncbi:MAG: DUF1573 domain-containing protein, partial [Bacteroidaceae bacterium]
MTIRSLFSFLAVASTLSVAAQPQVKFTQMQQPLGTILWHTPSETTFELTNVGDKPLLIEEVRTSCACTVAMWTKDSIQPGAKGQIRATFDAEMLGHFEKSVQVKTNASAEAFYLVMKGDVVRELVDYKGNYTFQVGEVLFSTDDVEFDNVNVGDRPQQVVRLINTGKRPYMPTLMHLPKYLSVQAVPEEVRGGRTGKLIITLNSKALPDMGLTKTSVFVSRYPGDRVSSEREMSISAVLLPAFSQLSQEQLAQAPSLLLDKERVLLDLQEGHKKAKGVVELTNKGNSLLKISA